MLEDGFVPALGYVVRAVELCGSSWIGVAVSRSLWISVAVVKAIRGRCSLFDCVWTVIDGIAVGVAVVGIAVVRLDLSCLEHSIRSMTSCGGWKA